MSTFRCCFAVVVLGFVGSGSGTLLRGQAVAPAPPSLPPMPPSYTGVKSNHTHLFSQTTPANPVLPPGLVPPPPVAQPNRAPQVPPGTPAPLVVPPAQPRPMTVTGGASQPASYLAWDAESKEYNAKFGEASARFTFHLTNVSKEVVLINSVRTSCGCTVAKLPEQPWHLAPSTNGPIEVSVNLAGKNGTITKSVTVDSSAGVKSLLVKVNIPAVTNAPVAGVDMDRMRNMQTALADRQAVFKGECAKCHSEPAKGQMGAQLYAAACGNCHDSPQRAALVPDLKKLNHPTNAEHWKKWIASGRAGSMMPAFAKSEGGPLDEAQIASLVKYLTDTIPSTPQSVANFGKPVVESPFIATPPAKVQ